MLAKHIDRVERAIALHHRAVRLDIARSRDRSWAGPRGPPAPEAALEDEIHAFIALKEAEELAHAALDGAGVQPHERNDVLAAAHRVLDRRSGADLPDRTARERCARHSATWRAPAVRSATPGPSRPRSRPRSSTPGWRSRRTSSTA
ncbi:hypothetical protein BJF90_09210 [Pseudonocardia sp. CNS-004]|nr:hypothetical protein BJF90_09210 [Pseudonocardia sp. CNS-004]